MFSNLLYKYLDTHPQVYVGDVQKGLYLRSLVHIIMEGRMGMLESCYVQPHCIRHVDTIYHYIFDRHPLTHRRHESTTIFRRVSVRLRSVPCGLL